MPDRVVNPALEATVGSRERKKEVKRRRIVETATRLFAEKGYDSVTADELARAADVGVGTLFRYAGSKAELLMSVMAKKLAGSIEAGIEQAKEGDTVVESIVAILRPLAEESTRHPENMMAYAREALFGTSSHRSTAAASVPVLECAIGKVLRMHDAVPRCPAIGLDEVAHAIGSTLFMDIVEIGTANPPVEDPPGRILESVRTLVRAMLED